MKRRILAIALAGALALSLAACGGGNSGGTSSGIGGSSSSSQTGGSSSDTSNPDGSQPDTSDPDGSGAASSNPDVKPLPSATLTLNRTNIELNKAGATFQLRYTTDPETDAAAFFSSSDEKVATVDGNGLVTAVAPGRATITVTLGSEVTEASASVNCSWKENQPAPAPSQPSGGSSSSSTPEIAPPDTTAQVDLTDFYTTTTGKYDFAFMMEADADMLASFFAGLSNVSTAQQVVYLCGMSPSPNGDFALVQVSDSKDVDTVKAIFQARIDYMVGDGNGPGGAFYPMEQTMWEENARIVTNGNYVMLIVHDNCDDIVNAFNALF